MKLLKIAKQGFIYITEDGQVSYNRAAIMKAGWKVKKAGNTEGIKSAWRTAKMQLQNMKMTIAEVTEPLKHYENFIDYYYDRKEIEAEIALEDSGEYEDPDLKALREWEEEKAAFEFKEKQYKRLRNFRKNGGIN
jgi:transcription elongation factor Elf1